MIFLNFGLRLVVVVVVIVDFLFFECKFLCVWFVLSCSFSNDSPLVHSHSLCFFFFFFFLVFFWLLSVLLLTWCVFVWSWMCESVVVAVSGLFSICFLSLSVRLIGGFWVGLSAKRFEWFSFLIVLFYLFSFLVQNFGPIFLNFNVDGISARCSRPRYHQRNNENTQKKNVRTVKERGTYTVWHMNEQDDMHVCVRLKCGCTFRNTDTNTHTFFWHLELLNAESTTVSIAVRLAICSKPHGVVQIDLFDAALSTLRCWCYSSICNRNKWTIELIKTTLNRSV